jgi:hypothetical protein
LKRRMGRARQFSRTHNFEGHDLVVEAVGKGLSQDVPANVSIVFFDSIEAELEGPPNMERSTRRLLPQYPCLEDVVIVRSFLVSPVEDQLKRSVNGDFLVSGAIFHEGIEFEAK